MVASGLIGVFQKLWADSWGPRLEYILRNSILAILDYPNSTLLAVTRMLSDKSFRKKVIDNIQDPVVKSFGQKNLLVMQINLRLRQCLQFKIKLDNSYQVL